ncbi:hypothetical protein SAMN04488082_11165 [Desulfomicrobium apsheronum]|uniref:Uncharacterized protein n=1 Tax=Desulfomicrobium apsheronum TaxID=52560 RepID=A0A1I3VV04_9BACT|nr:hypothetical protein [Desulfomicrobium apsheronum]SFJ99208.1 hypothetical protein SAMN04488082_11165 [Desulfomicrobium apsheronum]
MLKNSHFKIRLQKVAIPSKEESPHNAFILLEKETPHNAVIPFEERSTAKSLHPLEKGDPCLSNRIKKNFAPLPDMTRLPMLGTCSQE